MSYYLQAVLSEDPDMAKRIAACAATEGAVGYAPVWAHENQWAICAAPGWEADYSYAAEVEAAKPEGERNPTPLGQRSDVINDARILAAVQARITALAPVAG